MPPKDKTFQDFDWSLFSQESKNFWRTRCSNHLSLVGLWWDGVGFWVVGVDWGTVGDSAACWVTWVSDVVTPRLSIQDLWTSATTWWTTIKCNVTWNHLKFLQEERTSLNQPKEYFLSKKWYFIYSILFFSLI